MYLKKKIRNGIITKSSLIFMFLDSRKLDSRICAKIKRAYHKTIWYALSFLKTISYATVTFTAAGPF